MNEKSELRVALVGCGAVAREVHLPVLDALPGAVVCGICDLDEARVRELSDRFRVPGFADVAALLESGPDVVHVLTRPETHAEIALAALDAGCHVLVEKPFVYSAREAERVIERAREKQRRVSVVHNYLDHPSVTLLRQRIQEGYVGQLCSVHFLHGRRDQRYVPDPWYFATRGGRLGETLPHALYLVASLVPELRVRHVAARRLGRVQLPAHTTPAQAGHDELRVELDAEDGRYATILYSLNTALPQSLVAVGTDATLHALIGPEPCVRRWSTQAPDAPELFALAGRWAGGRIPGRLRRRAAGRESPHARQIQAFLASVRDGGEPPVSERDALEVVRLWEDVVERYEGAGA